MELLNDAQIDLVWAKVLDGNVHNEDLQNNLLDHICCFIEDHVAKGQSFDESFYQAVNAICPEGAYDIEEEFLFLENYNPQTTMKKIMFVSGFISVFSLSMSLLARHWRWEAGGAVFMLLGNVSLILLVLPSLSILAYKNRALMNLADKARMSLGILSGMAISVGMVFKYLRFPGANVTFATGMLIFCGLFLPIFFYQLYKRAYI